MTQIDAKMALPEPVLPSPAPLPETLDEFKAQMVAYGICSNKHQAHAIAHMIAQEVPQ